MRNALVTLRPPNPAADARDYHEFNLEPDMHTWTGNRVLDSYAEARAELELFVSLDDVSTWMILDNETERVVGRFFLVLEDRDGLRVVGEGNRIAKPYWRRGYNWASRTLLFPYAFAVLRADIIETEVWSGNVSSIRSIESFGFELDHEAEEWNDKHGRSMGKRYYTMSEQRYRSCHGDRF